MIILPCIHSIILLGQIPLVYTIPHRLAFQSNHVEFCILYWPMCYIPILYRMTVSLLVYINYFIFVIVSFQSCFKLFLIGLEWGAITSHSVFFLQLSSRQTCLYYSLLFYLSLEFPVECCTCYFYLSFTRYVPQIYFFKEIVTSIVVSLTKSCRYLKFIQSKVDKMLNVNEDIFYSLFMHTQIMFSTDALYSI